MSRIKGLWINSDLKPSNHNAEANARLIAAAPDLLEALDRVLASMSLERTENFKLLERCKQAVKKAKGE